MPEADNKPEPAATDLLLCETVHPTQPIHDNKRKQPTQNENTAIPQEFEKSGWKFSVDLPHGR